MICSK